MSQSRQTETLSAFPLHQFSEELVVEMPFGPPDLECQPVGEMDGQVRLSAMQQRDIRYLVAPRYTNIRSWCIRYRANRVLALYEKVARNPKTRDEEEADFEKLEDELEKYDRLMLNSNQVLSLEQPGQHFLEGCFRVFRETSKGGGDASFVGTLSTDWVSIFQPDRLDQLISHIPTTKLGKLMFKPFFKKTESFGGVETTHYHERAIRFIFFTFFSFIIGVFACAPAAIQALNVKSAAGEVAVYLVFVITFGWGIQGLIRGFEKLLLTCLAYSGLMANLL